MMKSTVYNVRKFLSGVNWNSTARLRPALDTVRDRAPDIRWNILLPSHISSYEAECAIADTYKPSCISGRLSAVCVILWLL